MAEKPIWKPLTAEQRKDLGHLIIPPGWRTIPAKDLPKTIFPDSWRTKIGSALVISGLTSTGGTYLYIGANRLDQPAGAIDIDPFGVVVHSSGPGADGVLICHGSWKGRTQKMPPTFWDEVDRSGVERYYGSRAPEEQTSGTLDQLPEGHAGAFRNIVTKLRENEDSKSP